MAARYANDIEIAKSQRDFELKKAAYDQEVQTKKATSDLAYDLQVNSCCLFPNSQLSGLLRKLLQLRGFFELPPAYLLEIAPNQIFSLH